MLLPTRPSLWPEGHKTAFGQYELHDGLHTKLSMVFIVAYKWDATSFDTKQH